MYREHGATPGAPPPMKTKGRRSGSVNEDLDTIRNLGGSSGVSLSQRKSEEPPWLRVKRNIHYGDDMRVARYHKYKSQG